jgi:hypothetical protein
MFDRASACSPTLGVHQPSLAPLLATPSVKCHRVTPLFATLTKNSQLTENSATLSPAFATLARYATSKSFACHSYRKLPGWSTPPSSSSLTSQAEPALRAKLKGSPFSRRSPLATRHSLFRFDPLLHSFTYTDSGGAVSFARTSCSLESGYPFEINKYHVAQKFCAPSCPKRSKGCSFLQFFAVFCILQNHISCIFNTIHALCAKHPGARGSRHSPLLSRDTDDAP